MKALACIVLALAVGRGTLAAGEPAARTGPTQEATTGQQAEAQEPTAPRVDTHTKAGENRTSITRALTGRMGTAQAALLAEYGGTATSQGAVGRALEWLKRRQRSDGSWSLQTPYANGAPSENLVAATAMALLAFQGSGHTSEQGEYRQQVHDGWRFLLKLQSPDGSFDQSLASAERAYSQGLAMIAVCEIYGMTNAPLFREPAQRAVDYAVKAQSPTGGWRYEPGIDSDTSVTGWYFMGLQSARMAGLKVPDRTLQRVSEYLDTAALDGGSAYKYRPDNEKSSPAMTAEALLCREYLGWNQDDPRLLRGAESMLRTGIDWEDRDVYYWYYATQVTRQLGGEPWSQWNRAMLEVIPKHQVPSGSEEGSWDPAGDRWGTLGGRLYVTCLSTYMLQVYYRHLPIYDRRKR